MYVCIYMYTYIYIYIYIYVSTAFKRRTCAASMSIRGNHSSNTTSISCKHRSHVYRIYGSTASMSIISLSLYIYIYIYICIYL